MTTKGTTLNDGAASGQTEIELDLGPGSYSEFSDKRKQEIKASTGVPNDLLEDQDLLSTESLNRAMGLQGYTVICRCKIKNDNVRTIAEILAPEIALEQILNILQPRSKFCVQLATQLLKQYWQRKNVMYHLEPMALATKITTNVNILSNENILVDIDAVTKTPGLIKYYSTLNGGSAIIFNVHINAVHFKTKARYTKAKMEIFRDMYHDILDQPIQFDSMAEHIGTTQDSLMGSEVTQEQLIARVDEVSLGYFGNDELVHSPGEAEIEITEELVEIEPEVLKQEEEVIPIDGDFSDEFSDDYVEVKRRKSKNIYRRNPSAPRSTYQWNNQRDMRLDIKPRQRAQDVRHREDPPNFRSPSLSKSPRRPPLTEPTKSQSQGTLAGRQSGFASSTNQLAQTTPETDRRMHVYHTGHRRENHPPRGLDRNPPPRRVEYPLPVPARFVKSASRGHVDARPRRT